MIRPLELVSQSPTGLLEARFDRDASRYSWVSRLKTDHSFRDWNVSVLNRFQSEAFTQRSTISEFRDENRLLWSVSRSYSPKLSFIGLGSLDWFSQVDAYNSGNYVGFRYRPTGLWSIESFGGVAFDQRQGIRLEDGSVPIRNDNGPALGFRSSLGSYQVGSYLLDYQAEGNWQSLKPRTRRAIQSRAGVARQYGQTLIRLTARFANFRRDSYQAASFLNRDQQRNRSPETVEASINDTLATVLSVESRLSDRIQFISSLGFDAFDRDIRTLSAPSEVQFFDTDFARRSLQFRMGLEYRGQRLSGRIFAERGATIERRDLVNIERLPQSQVAAKTDLLRQADFDRGSLRFGFNSTFLAFPSWSLRFSGNGNIKRHDTPEGNFDDRDELLYTALIRSRYELSDRFNFLVNLAGDTYHTVYLKSSRSAENSRRNSLRLYPGVEWRKDIDSFFRFNTEVRATYTVDDFLIEGRPKNDQSARELKYSLSLSRPLGEELIVKADLSTSDLILGRLRWEEFAEIPFDTLNISSAWIRLKTGKALVGELGWRVLVRSDYDRNASVRYSPIDDNGDVILDDQGDVLSVLFSGIGRRQITQFGPTASLSWEMPTGSRLFFDGWIQRQKISERLYAPFPSGQEEAIQNAGKKGTTRYVPNFSIAVSISF